MEQKLRTLFDFQRFAGNTRLSAILGDVESRYAKADLSDDDLDLVSAAGTTCVPTVKVEPLLARHDIPDDEEKKTW